MKIATFVGYANHLDELDFDYVVVDKYFNNMTDEQLRDYRDRIIWNDTQESDLRLRINKQLRKVISTLESVERSLSQNENDKYFAIIDSDLIIPNLRKIEDLYGNAHVILSPCYYALHKGKNYIAPWCFGTNFIFHRSLLTSLKLAIYSYSDSNEPVDGYIHFHIPISHVIIDRTKHYIKTENGEIAKIITKDDWLETINHNFVPIEVIRL